MGKKKNKRGNGSIHLRKDGRWEGRVVVGYDDKGLPKAQGAEGQHQQRRAKAP